MTRRKLNYEMGHRMRFVLRHRETEGAPGEPLPTIWSKRRSRLRRSPSGVLLRKPHK